MHMLPGNTYQQLPQYINFEINHAMHDLLKPKEKDLDRSVTQNAAIDNIFDFATNSLVESNNSMNVVKPKKTIYAALIGVHQLTFIPRLILAIQVIALTIFTFGIGPFVSKWIYDKGELVHKGQRTYVACVKLDSLPEKLRRSAAISVCRRLSCRFEDLPVEYQNDRKFIIDLLHYKLDALLSVDDFLLSREFIIEAIKSQPKSIGFLPHHLNNDFELIRIAINREPDSFEYAHSEFKRDPAEVLNVVQKDGLLLRFAANDLKNNPEIVLAAVNQNGMALQFASAHLRAQRNIVLAAVQQNGLALQYADDSLINVREIVLPALKNNGMALRHASYQIKNNKEIVYNTIKKTPDAFDYVSEALKMDPDLLQELDLQAQDKGPEEHAIHRCRVTLKKAREARALY
ncbi:MAG: DUF4116 domain-containing protein [Parachlamydiaceae bacterium]|nr:DUF4116 domain-containing protein [Parachlamydiaceae bacterium]